MVPKTVKAVTSDLRQIESLLTFVAEEASSACCGVNLAFAGFGAGLFFSRVGSLSAPQQRGC
jgi:hypothetical protein